MSHTRTINIFLASSNELINDRNSFQAFIASLDDIYESRGWRIKCRRWEDFPAYCTGSRTQDAYNKIVRASDMCIALFHMQAGQYTIEEFNQAMDGYRECGHPKTYVYARVVIDGEMESEELKAFKQQLNEVMGHYWCSYTTDDAMKLHFVMQFERLMNPEEGISAHQESALQVKEGVVRLHGREVARYENLAFASENEEYKRLKGEIASLEKDIVMLRSLQNEALQPMIIEKLTQQNQARELLGKLEDNLFDTALYISKMLGSDTPITPRKRLAIEFFEKGNNKGVIDTLRMEDIAADAEDAAQRREKLRQMRESIDAADKQIIEEIRSIIEEYGLRAKALMQEYSNPNHFTEACQAYEAGIALAEKHLDQDEIAKQYFVYASFLQNNNQFDHAIEFYKQALEIRTRLAEQHPEAYLPDVAMTQNNLANLYSDTNRPDEAEELYKQALEIYTRLAEQHPEAYLPDVAVTQNNLANLYCKTNRLGEAEVLYKEALDVYTRLAEQYPEAYLQYVARTQNNLAALYSDTNHLDEAEVLYKEALDIYTQLAEQHPEAYLPDVAMTQNNLAILYSKTNQLGEAEVFYKKALDVYTQLAEQYPEAYLPDVALTQNDLANLYSDTNRLQEAEVLYKQALEIHTHLAEQHPKAYLQYVANTLNNLATLYYKTNLLQKALSMAQKALETYTTLNNMFDGHFANEIESANQLIEMIKHDNQP